MSRKIKQNIYWFTYLNAGTCLRANPDLGDQLETTLLSNVMLAKSPFTQNKVFLDSCMQQGQHKTDDPKLVLHQQLSANAINIHAASHMTEPAPDENDCTKANLAPQNSMAKSFYKELSPSGSTTPKIESHSSAEQHAELEASVSAKIDAELFELATVRWLCRPRFLSTWPPKKDIERNPTWTNCP